jgi:hypothetical protein
VKVQKTGGDPTLVRGTPFRYKARSSASISRS